MKLVGATNWFIRWPFLTEGIIIGVVGAMLPFVIIAYGYHIAYSTLGRYLFGGRIPLDSDNPTGTNTGAGHVWARYCDWCMGGYHVRPEVLEDFYAP